MADVTFDARPGINLLQGSSGKEDWLRGQDLNLRPSGYEPDELPGCSTPRPQGEALAPHPDIDEPRSGLSFCRGNCEAVAPVRRFRRHAGAKPFGFCSCKGRTVISGASPIHFALHLGLWKAERTALGGPFVSALAVM